MAHVIVVGTEKGGTGKTSTTYQLAHFAAQLGPTLMVDNDPSADLSNCFLTEVTPKEASFEGPANTAQLYRGASLAALAPLPVKPNLYLMASNDRLATLAGDDLAASFRVGVAALRPQFDWIFIDCVPSFGDLFTASIAAADQLVMPVLPDKFSFEAAKNLKARLPLIQRLYPGAAEVLGMVVNQLDTYPITAVSKYYLNEFDQEFGSLMFKTAISRSVKIKESLSLNEALSEDKQKGHRSVEEFEAFWREFLTRVGVAHV